MLGHASVANAIAHTDARLIAVSPVIGLPPNRSKSIGVSQVSPAGNTWDKRPRYQVFPRKNYAISMVINWRKLLGKKTYRALPHGRLVTSPLSIWEWRNQHHWVVSCIGFKWFHTPYLGWCRNRSKGPWWPWFPGNSLAVWVPWCRISLEPGWKIRCVIFLRSSSLMSPGLMVMSYISKVCHPGFGRAISMSVRISPLCLALNTRRTTAGVMLRQVPGPGAHESSAGSLMTYINHQPSTINLP